MWRSISPRSFFSHRPAAAVGIAAVANDRQGIDLLAAHEDVEADEVCREVAQRVRNAIVP